MEIILLSLALVFLLLFLTSLIKVKKSNKKINFIYSWGCLLGAFVWEDLLVFSFYFLAITLITLLVQDVHIWILFVLIFWMVRSSGEALYFFLQQFIVPKHYPHDLAEHIKRYTLVSSRLSDQQVMILMQVFYQVMLTITIGTLVLFLLNWNSIPIWIY